MASKCDNMPSTLWIWDMTTLELASVLIHTSPVKSFKFSPSSNDLYVVTGSGRVYTWAPQGASVIELPQSGFGKDLISNTTLNKVRWNPNARNLLLMDKGELLIGIPPGAIV
jgi:WD40 repeat protein